MALCTSNKNLTAHYNSQLCVSFHFCFNQKSPRGLLMCLNIGSWSSYPYIWVKMPRKNNGLFDVLFSQSLWLKCNLLCLPGGLVLDCSWTALQCESPQVISLAKFKYLHIFGIFLGQTLNCHYCSTVWAFDLIPKLRARPEYQLSSGSKYTAWLASAFHPDRNLP